MILTTYLTIQVDPQRCHHVLPDDPNAIQMLADVRRLGLEIVIFHDGLSPAFVESHGSGTIRFVRVASSADVSNNDYRFFLFRDWIEAHPKVPRVFCTDLFDVRIRRNPMQVDLPANRLWVSHEPWTIDADTPEGRYVSSLLKYWYGPDWKSLGIFGHKILNPGVWGGARSLVLRALRLVSAEILRLRPGPRGNCNLSAFNYVLHCQLGLEQIWSEGRPLHSTFGKYESEADVCFIHK